MHISPVILGVGIDISKKKFDVAFLSEDHKKHFSFSNSDKGIEALSEKLRSYTGKIVLESTGRYHLLCAFLLSQNGFDVRVLNPLISRRYLSTKIHNHKTDKADATLLAEIALGEKNLPQSFSASKEDISLRQKVGLLSSLEKQIQRLEAILREYTEFQKNMHIPQDVTEVSFIQITKDLKKKKSLLQKEIEERILQSEEKNLKCSLLTSIPGVSPFVAALLLQFFDASLSHPKQWIAYAGMDILSRQSGTWNGRGRISHRGNPYFRKRFFGAGWGAMMHHESFRKYYDELKKEGKSHVEALLILSRKILRIAFVLLKKNEPFDEKFLLSS